MGDSVRERDKDGSFFLLFPDFSLSGSGKMNLTNGLTLKNEMVWFSLDPI
jgi:hypothetical protein